MKNCLITGNSKNQFDYLLVYNNCFPAILTLMGHMHFVSVYITLDNAYERIACIEYYRGKWAFRSLDLRLNEAISSVMPHISHQLYVGFDAIPTVNNGVLQECLSHYEVCNLPDGALLRISNWLKQEHFIRPQGIG